MKKGLVYKPPQHRTWSLSHAQVPTVDILDHKTWRIYYGTRDAENRSRTSYIDVEAGNPSQVLYVHDQPVLPLGRLGAFDDCGVMPSWVITHNKLKYLYYIGWTVRNTIPYHNSVGVAVSKDGGSTFRRVSEGPLLGTTFREPYFTGTSCVLVEDGLWRMWYLSCTKWEIHEGKPEPYYHIKYAESQDGIHWIREGKVAIDYTSEQEGGIVKASVLKENGRYKMWYSFRAGQEYRTNVKKSYRIGYAESQDGIKWTRKDEEVGIDVSASGWDSEMLAYPHVVSHGDKKFMFYNGNGFGLSGFGYAVSTP